MELTSEEKKNLMLMIDHIEEICRTVLDGNSESFSSEYMTLLLKDHSDHWQELHVKQVMWLLEALGHDVHEEIDVESYYISVEALKMNIRSITSNPESFYVH